MSYRLSIWNPARPLSADEIAQTWELLERGEATPLLLPSDQLGAFAGAIDALEVDQDDDEGRGPWVASDLDGTTHVEVRCLWTHRNECGPQIVDLATLHNLAIFDPQTELLYRPPHHVQPYDCTLASPVLLADVPAHDEIIPEILAALPCRDDPYLAVCRSEQIYAQVVWSEDEFRLDYSEGDPARRLELIELVPAAIAAALLRTYAAGQPWSADLRFRARANPNVA